MAIEKKLIHFSKLSDFEIQLNAGNILDYSIVFIQDAKKIWTHGQYYDCNGGSYEDLQDKLIYITPFDVLSLYNLAKDSNEIIQVDKQAIIEALAANKIVLVPYEISDNINYRGYAILIGYTEDLLYFKVITDSHEFIVETSPYTQDIISMEVTLRDWGDKQERLISGTNIKTINGESILGEGNLIVEGGAKVYNFDYNAAAEAGAVTQDVYDAIIAADIVKADGVYLDKVFENETLLLHSTVTYTNGDGNSVELASVAMVLAIGADLSFTPRMGSAIIPTKTSQLENDSNFISSDNLKTINGESIVGSGNLVIEDGIYIWDWDGSDSGTITQDQWNALRSADNILVRVNTSINIPLMLNKGDNSISMYLITTIGLTLWQMITINIDSNLSYFSSYREATYLRSGALKTINGESLEGSGDIVINGGSSSGSSAYSEVSHGTADTTFTLTPNTFHIWDEVSSLTLTLGAETSGVANEYLFQFTSGSEPTTLSLPDDIKWTGGETPTIEANKIYQISILKGLGSVLEWDTKVLIDNLCTYDGMQTITFQYPIASDVHVYIGTSMDMSIDAPLSVGETTVTFSGLPDPGSSILAISPTRDDTYNYIF